MVGCGNMVVKVSFLRINGVKSERRVSYFPSMKGGKLKREIGSQRILVRPQ